MTDSELATAIEAAAVRRGVPREEMLKKVGVSAVTFWRIKAEKQPASRQAAQAMVQLKREWRIRAG